VRLGLRYQAEYQPGFVVLPFGGAGADAVRAIVRQDLDYSDRFEMKEADAGVRAGEPVNTRLWKERGADYVLEGELTGSGGSSALRLVLHDAVYGQKKGEHTFSLPPAGSPGFRMAVHAAADEVVRWATGDPGAAATRIAFVQQGRGAKEIYLVDFDGENVQRVTGDGSISLSPAWSPDGARLAFTSYRSGAPLLYERDLASGRDRLLSDRQGINITPAYAPDGRSLAFASTVAGATEVVLSDLARGGIISGDGRGGDLGCLLLARAERQRDERKDQDLTELHAFLLNVTSVALLSAPRATAPGGPPIFWWNSDYGYDVARASRGDHAGSP
jgi:TolB protein